MRADQAGVEPAWALEGVPARERDLWARAIEAGVNAPVTSSAGRLFDAVSSLAGVRQVASFEGQAAMELEWAVDPRISDAYPWRLGAHEGPAPGTFAPPPLVVNWAPAVAQVLADVAAGTPVGVVAARWHNTMAEMIVGVARSVGRARVVLSGGCFQNAVLCERVDSRLRAEGFTPYWHQRVPPNDGGIALGQIVAALRH